jgi:hypothetical protein
MFSWLYRLGPSGFNSNGPMLLSQLSRIQYTCTMFLHSFLLTQTEDKAVNVIQAPPHRRSVLWDRLPTHALHGASRVQAQASSKSGSLAEKDGEYCMSRCLIFGGGGGGGVGPEKGNPKKKQKKTKN